MTPVDLIIPDAGPLISLAHADRLELVEVFDRPVAILDIVKLECLRKDESPDHSILKNWFDRQANSIRIIETPFHTNYDQALQDEISGRNWRATRGMGDAAYSWLLPNLDLVVPRGTIPLVLTEDKNLSMTLSNEKVAHVLSTRAWLRGLENAGVIDSAADIVAAINQHGRNLSPLVIDRQLEDGAVLSDWVSALRKPPSDPS